MTEPIRLPWMQGAPSKKVGPELVLWYVFSATTALLVAMMGTKWLFALLCVAARLAVASRVLVWPFLVVVFMLIAPVVVLAGNAWLFREALLKRGCCWATKKFDVGLARPAVEGTAALATKSAELGIANVSVHETAAAVGPPIVTVAAVKAAARYCKGQVLVDAVVQDVNIHFVTYDMRFRDTNVQRLADKLSGAKNGKKDAAQEAAPAKKEEKKKDKPFVVTTVTLRNVVIAVKSSGDLGVRSIIPPIVLEDEKVDPAVLASLPRTLLWLNGVVARAVANSSMDAVGGALSAGSGALTGAAGGFKNAGLSAVGEMKQTAALKRGLETMSVMRNKEAKAQEETQALEETKGDDAAADAPAEKEAVAHDGEAKDAAAAASKKKKKSYFSRA
ncbi:hypothetical protein M885DRAFT_627147 [Pelagophyceae sp. CCMP2097]|nr:hypothetical protein M885DRAFT_627147 [Pelagophyceae sp. CCMP2097]